MVKKTMPKNRKSGTHYISAGITSYVYRVIIEPDGGRYYAEVPALPGCYSWGYTYEGALKNVKEALELWLEMKKEEGETIPLEDPRAIRKAPLTVGVMV